MLLSLGAALTPPQLLSTLKAVESCRTAGTTITVSAPVLKVTAHVVDDSLALDAELLALEGTSPDRDSFHPYIAVDGQLLFQTIVPLASDACIGGKETALGYGDVLIDVPDGWSIDKGTAYLELATYLLKRPKSSETTMRIVLSASSTHEDLGPGAQPYCANGLYGATLVKDGMRTIRLDIPPPAEPRPYDSKAILSFRSSDRDAEKVAATLHLKGPERKCPHS